ncbi:MAG TPA: amidohydrolase, partial [Planctomycetaceae bacterium]|nr:amidohydrolase [Planctomycetaceae bacterium]
MIDPHTHINPHQAASRTLADILGYHYYTELAHSAGLPKEQIEEPGIEPREKVRRLAPWLKHLENTAQYSWLLEMSQQLFGFQGERIDETNWESLYEASLKCMSAPDWEQQVLQKSGLDQVYLTNDFDDPLTGFDTSFYVPCLRTDDLVFHLCRPAVQQRLQQAAATSVTDATSLRDAVGRLFEHFTANNARACAISLPPTFSPASVSAVA